MTPTEIVMLTGYLRAHFPSQPVDEYTTEALGELLAPYPAADCRLAVLRLAERGEKWCAPTEVRAEVKRIRGKRIAEAGDLTPPPDLTPLETIDWLKDVRRRIGDGETTDDLAAYGELKKRHMPDLRRMLPSPDDDSALRDEATAELCSHDRPPWPDAEAPRCVGSAPLTPPLLPDRRRD